MVFYKNILVDSDLDPLDESEIVFQSLLDCFGVTRDQYDEAVREWIQKEDDFLKAAIIGVEPLKNPDLWTFLNKKFEVKL